MANMPRVADLYFKTAVLFLIVGIGFGLQMAMTNNHNVIPAHAHINLLGWVTSAIFGIYFALNPGKAEGRLPMIQYGLFTIGVVVMAIGLYLLLLGNTALEPIVAGASMVTFVGVLIFAWIIFMPARR